MRKLQAMSCPTEAIVVCIGVQARSGSKRFPRKMESVIGNRSVLQHVVQNVIKARQYLNNFNSKNISVDAYLLVPIGDPLVAEFSKKIDIIEGHEQDVLSRYVELQKVSQADFIVRITGDCPLIPPFLISKLITLAVTNQYDYVSNVDERCRTTPDGWDCEVISKRLLEHVNLHALQDNDREHVTTFVRREPPSWAMQGAVINFLDLHEMKISIDTELDLELVRQEYNAVEEAYDRAVKIFGRSSVHRI